MFIRYVFFWLVLMLVAVANGALRQLTYGEWVSTLLAHQISTFTGVLFTGFAVYSFMHSRPLDSKAQAWLIGGAWLMLTLLFEFIFGYHIAGHSWDMLFYDYNLLAGRVWLVFLVWVLVMPYVFYRISRASLSK